jgi:hypothetical protein
MGEDAKRIAKVVTELSAEGSDVVISQTTTAIAKPLCEATERIRTVVAKKEVAGVAISERTTTSVIFEETAQTIVDAERSERIRKLGLVDRPIDWPGKNPAHRPPTVDAVLRRDEMAELSLWLKDSRRDLRKGQRPVLQKHRETLRCQHQLRAPSGALAQGAETPGSRRGHRRFPRAACRL